MVDTVLLFISRRALIASGKVGSFFQRVLHFEVEFDFRLRARRTHTHLRAIRAEPLEHIARLGHHELRLRASTHKATVVGDTVGDPFKDTSGPSLNILIKLMSMVSIVMAGLTVAFI